MTGLYPSVGLLAAGCWLVVCQVSLAAVARATARLPSAASACGTVVMRDPPFSVLPG